jgi:predicted amidohydrolase YtcJ
MQEIADLVLVNGKITTLDRTNPQASAVAIRDGRFQAVGAEREIIGLQDRKRGASISMAVASSLG